MINGNPKPSENNPKFNYLLLTFDDFADNADSAVICLFVLWLRILLAEINHTLYMLTGQTPGIKNVKNKCQNAEQ